MKKASDYDWDCEEETQNTKQSPDFRNTIKVKHSALASLSK